MCSKLSPPGIYLLRWGGLGKGVVGWCVRAARLCHGRLGTRQTRTCLNAYPCARHPWSSSESESSAAALQARAIWFRDEPAPRAAAHQEHWADTWRCSRSLPAILKVEVIRSNPTIETQRPLRQRKAASHRAPRIWLHVTKLWGGGNPRPFLCQRPRLPLSNRRSRNVPLSHNPSDKEKTTTTNKQCILI